MFCLQLLLITLGSSCPTNQLQRFPSASIRDITAAALAGEAASSLDVFSPIHPSLCTTPPPSTLTTSSSKLCLASHPYIIYITRPTLILHSFPTSVRRVLQGLSPTHIFSRSVTHLFIPFRKQTQ